VGETDALQILSLSDHGRSTVFKRVEDGHGNVALPPSRSPLGALALE
jgi:hypothetical protein